MSGVFISNNARAAVVIREFVRNGKAPVAELQNRLAETLGHAVIAHTKQIFSRYSPIAAIPSSAGSSRTRWRFAFHSGPYARLIGVRMELAPQDDGAGATSPYSQLDIAKASTSSVTAGTTRVYYGSSNGSFEDIPRNFGGGLRFLDSGGDYEWVLPDTEYVGTFYDYDRARLFGASVFEVSLEPDTTSGFPSASHGAGGPIYDEDRRSSIAMARSLWARTAVPLWHGGSETTVTARSVASDSAGGILAESIGEFVLTATGTVEVQGALSQSMGVFNLSAQGQVVGAQPEWHSTGTEDTDASTVSPAWPDHTTDDIGVLYVAWSKNDTNGTLPTTPSGWTYITATQFSEAIIPEIGDPYFRYYWLATYYVRATSGSMTAPTVDMSSHSINEIAGVILTYRGCTTSGSPVDAIGTNNETSGTSLLIGPPSSVGINRLIIGAARTVASTVSGFTNATYTSPTERFDSNGVTVGDAGSVYNINANFTGTLSAASQQGNITIALKP